MVELGNGLSSYTRSLMQWLAGQEQRARWEQQGYVESKVGSQERKKGVKGWREYGGKVVALHADNSGSITSTV